MALVYKHTRAVLDDFCRDLQQEYDKRLGSSRHTPIVKYTIYKTNIRIYITDPDEIIYIENGRKPGKFPPVNKLQDWVKRNITTELPRVKSLSYLIGRKISQEGLPGHHILDKLLPTLQSKYEKRIDDALTEDVDYDVIKGFSSELDKIFSKL